MILLATLTFYLVGTGTIPEMISDIAGVIRWTLANASAYGADPNNVWLVRADGTDATRGQAFCLCDSCELDLPLVLPFLGIQRSFPKRSVPRGVGNEL